MFWNSVISADQGFLTHSEWHLWFCSKQDAKTNPWDVCVTRHYNDVTMSTIASQITSLTIVSTVYSGADQRKHQSSASLAFVWGIHRGPVNSPHKWPVTRKMFPFDDVIMEPSQIQGSGCAISNLISECYGSDAITCHRNVWWRHQMETFSASLALCQGNSPVTGEFHSQRPVTPSFDVSVDLRMNIGSRRRWLETPSRSLCRHCSGKWTNKMVQRYMYVGEQSFLIVGTLWYFASFRRSNLLFAFSLY